MEKDKDDLPCMKLEEYLVTDKELKESKGKKYYGSPEFYKIIDELKELHSKKSKDYNSENDPMSNFKICEKAGIPAWKGIVVRLSDKFSRLLSFCKREEFEVNDESVEDTLRDLANYSILCMVAYRERIKK